MNKLIIATHGNLSFGLKETYEMVAGEIPENVSFLSLRKDSDINTFKQEFLSSIENLNFNDDILILVDLEGGSPYNVACEYYYSEKYRGKIEIITGVNFPMLVQAIEELNSSTLKELADETINQGKNCIVRAKELINLENEEEF